MAGLGEHKASVGIGKMLKGKKKCVLGRQNQRGCLTLYTGKFYIQLGECKFRFQSVFGYVLSIFINKKDSQRPKQMSHCL